MHGPNPSPFHRVSTKGDADSACASSVAARAACVCFLPTCAACFPGMLPRPETLQQLRKKRQQQQKQSADVASGITAASFCCCFLPVCAACSPTQNVLREQRLSQPQPTEALAASVGDASEQIFAGGFSGLEAAMEAIQEVASAHGIPLRHSFSSDSDASCRSRLALISLARGQRLIRSLHLKRACAFSVSRRARCLLSAKDSCFRTAVLPWFGTMLPHRCLLPRLC